VERHRLDNPKAISESAVKFHYLKPDGAIAHVSLEPDVQQKMAAGEAALISFMGYNGLAQAVVPKDLALDVAAIKPEWLRVLAGVTDQAEPTAEAIAESEIAEAHAAEAKAVDDAAKAALAEAQAAAPMEESSATEGESDVVTVVATSVHVEMTEMVQESASQGATPHGALSDV
jgi:hypothetical protein